MSPDVLGGLADLLLLVAVLMLGYRVLKIEKRLDEKRRHGA